MKARNIISTFCTVSAFWATTAAAQPRALQAGDDLQVFSETTSFEQMIAQKQEAIRAPASLEPLARVIGLKREIGLSNAESDKAQHDIILNGGTNSGFTEGMIVSVVRKVPVIDPYRENAQSELEVEFARIKIVHVQKEISVARLETMESIDRGMYLGTRGILVGDFVAQSKR